MFTATRATPKLQKKTIRSCEEMDITSHGLVLLRNIKKMVYSCRMSQRTNEFPVFGGCESGQRKRYLRSLEQDLAAELGPDWREKIANSFEGYVLVDE